MHESRRGRLGFTYTVFGTLRSRLLVAASLFAAALPAAAEPPGTGWGTPVLSDNFTSIDTSTWSVRDWSDWNNHSAAYTGRSSNVNIGTGIDGTTDGSALQLIALRENYNGRSYTGGMLDTMKKKWFNDPMYFEGRVRYKVQNANRGFWGNIFTFGANPADGSHRWPPELNLAEMTSAKDRQMFINNHYAEETDSSNRPHRSQAIFKTGFDYTTWHTYGVLYASGSATFYIDGVPVYTHPEVELDDAHYLVLRMGTTGGADGSSLWDSGPDAATVFPGTMQVDWVKVWNGGTAGFGETTRYEAENLSYSGTGATVSVIADARANGGKWLQLNSDSATDKLSITVPSVSSGYYTVSYRFKKRDNMSDAVQFKANTANLGGTFNQYLASGRENYDQFFTKAMGVIYLSGNETFELVPTSVGGTSGWDVSLDSISLTKVNYGSSGVIHFVDR
jgi:hypothetical protein